MLLSPWPAAPVKRELPLRTSAMRLPHLAVAGAGQEKHSDAVLTC